MLSKNTNTAQFLHDSVPVFLLNPNNRGLLGNARALSRTFSLATLMLILGLLGLVAAGWFFASGATELFTTAQLINSGITVQGQIVNFQPGKSPSIAQGFLYPVTYRFSPARSATTLSKEELVRKDVYDRLHDGIVVAVKYLPTDPSISMLVGADAERTFEGKAFTALAIGAVGLILAVVYLLPPMRQRWQEWRVRKSGRLIVGQVLYCRRYAPVSLTRPDSPDYDAGLVRNFHVELSYRFQTPEGKEIRGRTRYKRNDLRGTRLPTFGAPVAILYLDQRNHQVL